MSIILKFTKNKKLKEIILSETSFWFLEQGVKFPDNFVSTFALENKAAASLPPPHTPFRCSSSHSVCVCVCEEKKEKTFHEQPTNIFKMSTRNVELKLLLHSLQVQNELSLWFSLSLHPRQSRS